MTNEELLEARRQNVTKANKLITDSRFSLTVSEQKLIMYIISLINANDRDFELYKIKIKDFCRLCNISENSNKNAEDIKQCIEKIAQKYIWITLEDGRKTMLRWVEKAYIDKASINIRLDADMKPFLLNLRDHFTQYELGYILKLKSKYSIRLYEAIKAWHFNEFKPYTVEKTIDYLRELLDFPETYPNQAIKNKVIEVAVDEINERTDKNLRIEYVTGVRNKLEAVRFTISTKEILDRIKVMP